MPWCWEQPAWCSGTGAGEMEARALWKEPASRVPQGEGQGDLRARLLMALPLPKAVAWPGTGHLGFGVEA